MRQKIANILSHKSIFLILSLLLLFAGLVFYFYIISKGWKNEIDDIHGFRQTQTAITAYYIAKDGFSFDYITPVLGPDWKIPMEFPMYQSLVVWFHQATNISLDISGRYVSVISYLLSCFFLFKILREFQKCLVFSSFVIFLMLINPIYLFWSRTFLLETTALFFGMAFLYFSIKSIKNQKPLFIFLALFLGSLAALTKITTFSVFINLVILFFIILKIDYFKTTFISKKISKELLVQCFQFSLLLIIPIIVGSIWVMHTDQIKNVGFQSHGLTSKSLSDWNYGTWELKLSIDTWLEIFKKSNLGVFKVILFSLILVTKSKKLLLIVFFSWLFPMLVFTNLYFEHAYYAVANQFLLVVLYVLLLEALVKRFFNKWMYFVCLVLTGFLIYNQIIFFKTNYLEYQKANNVGVKSISHKIQKYIPANEVMIYYGDDWNSRFPYYTERKSMAWKFVKDTLPNFKKLEKLLNKQKIGGVFFFGPKPLPNSNAYKNLLYLDFNLKPKLVHDSDTNWCFLYIPKGR